MTLTMFLLGLVFVGFVAALVGILTALHQSDGVIIFFPVVLGLGLGIGSLFYSDKIALRAAGARVVTPEEAPQLHGIIDRLCALADMPKPVVAIAPTDMPNAFATGRSSKKSVVCVTQGILRRLDREELEGVIAHEMSHVAHKDVVVMTVASFLAIIAGLMIRFAFYSELFGGGGRGRNNNSGGQVAIMMMAVMAVSAVIYAISFLLIRLLSRYRELAADRSGALLTGQPSKLASALQKVSGEIARIPTKDLRAHGAAEALNAFYFAPALTPGRSGAGLANLFSTHPSLEKRLEQLAKISEQLGK
jgi:heat shock protein HtpX